MNLLIVDDDVNMLHYICQELDTGALGIRNVYTSVNIEGAKNIIREKDIYLLVCDIEMPGGSGLELMEWIQEKHLLMEIILITCHARFEYARRAVALQASDYVLKPIRIPELQEAIRRAILHLRQEPPKSQRGVSQVPVLDLELVREFIFTKKWDQTLELLEQWLGGFPEGRYLNNREMQRYQYLLEHTCYSFLEKYGGVPDEVYPDDTRLLFKTALTDKDHFRKWAVSMLACLRGFYDRQKGNSIVREIKAYLEDHYPQDITLQNLAEDFNYSKDYITKIFRQEEGCGPFEYLAEYRVKQSCILLGDARLSVGEIASMTGFNSISYFSKTFRKLMGKSPKEYRKTQ